MARIAGKIKRWIKIVVWGVTGGGKTRFGFDGGTYKISDKYPFKAIASEEGEMWPGLLVLNAEGGSVPYENTFSDVEGIPPFVVEDCKTIARLMAICKEIKDTGGIKLEDGTFFKVETILVDPWTKFRDVFRAGVSKNASGSLGKLEFAKINAEMQIVEDALDELPCHLILVIHETDEYAPGVNGAKIGVKIDADQKVKRLPDFELEFRVAPGANVTKTGTTAYVRKTRGIPLGDTNGIVKNPSWKKHFKPVAAAWSAGTLRPVETDDAAAEIEAQRVADKETNTDVKKVEAGQGRTFATNKKMATAWGNQKVREGYKPQALREALGASSFQFEGTPEQADALLAKWKTQYDARNLEIKEMIDARQDNDAQSTTELPESVRP